MADQESDDFDLRFAEFAGQFQTAKGVSIQNQILAAKERDQACQEAFERMRGVVREKFSLGIEQASEAREERENHFAARADALKQEESTLSGTHHAMERRLRDVPRPAFLKKAGVDDVEDPYV